MKIFLTFLMLLVAELSYADDNQQTDQTLCVQQRVAQCVTVCEQANDPHCASLCEENAKNECRQAGE